MPYVNNEIKQIFRHQLTRATPNIVLHEFTGRSTEVMAASDVVLAASGTAALEAALLRKPMVVAYKVSRFSYWLARRVASTPYVSMTNNLVASPLVPEVLQEAVSGARLCDELWSLLSDANRYSKIEESLDNVYRLFEVNLASNKNDRLNEEASVEFINTLTDILHQLKIDVLEIKPIEKYKSGKYTYIPYKLKLACDFEKFGKLASELERNERLITISEFEYTNSPENVRRTSELTELPNSIIEMEIATITLNKSKR